MNVSNRMAGPVIAAAMVIAVATSAFGAGGSPLKITGAWSRPTPPGAPTAAGYLTIANTGATPDKLLSADTPAAASLTLHSMSNAGGVMRMRAVPEGLTLPPHSSVTLNPDGYHLMFEGLKGPFKTGGHVPAVLHFEHAGAVRVSFDVGDGPKADAMAGMAMH